MPLCPDFIVVAQTCCFIGQISPFISADSILCIFSICILTYLKSRLPKAVATSSRIWKLGEADVGHIGQPGQQVRHQSALGILMWPRRLVIAITEELYMIVASPLRRAIIHAAITKDVGLSFAMAYSLGTAAKMLAVTSSMGDKRYL